MKKTKLAGTTISALAIILVVVAIGNARAEDAPTKTLDPSLLNLKIGLTGFFEYSAGQSPLPHGDEENFNRFALTRGYINFQAQIAEWMSARVTPDIMQETNGDYKLRMKFYFAEFKLPDLGPMTTNRFEAGMIRTPWLDFEEKINNYRAQGTHPSDRAGLFVSADLGVSFNGNIGPKIEDLKKRTGNDAYAGKFGSWHIGVYNGGGYNAVENNQNKVLEGRISLRPLGGWIPGFQLSYAGAFGEGNTEVGTTGEYPDYILHLGAISFEHPRFALLGQYYISEGNYKGNLIDTNGDTFVTEGYSIFGKVKIPVLNDRPGLFVRYDYYDGDVDSKVADDATYEMWIFGASFDIYKGNMLILAYETTDYGDGFAGKGKLPKADTNLGNDQKLQVILQVKY